VAPERVVFLLDVDNTLLDNDRVITDLMGHLEREIGPECHQRYWKIFEDLRTELGYADYLGALQRYRVEHPRDLNLPAISAYLINYPFASRLYPSSLDVVDHLKGWGPAVILTDGDVVFQPRKVERSGLLDVVDGKVLIYIHKEREIEDIESRYPADHYVVIDDKLRILASLKDSWRTKVTTVFPQQGHYATDPEVLKKYPAADISIRRIGDMLGYDLPDLLAAGQG
jgi:FMN phosphatase YigB (HAD superfamily)